MVFLPCQMSKMLDIPDCRIKHFNSINKPDVSNYRSVLVHQSSGVGHVEGWNSFHYVNRESGKPKVLRWDSLSL